MAKPTIGMMTYSFGKMVNDGEIDVAGIVRYCGELGLDAVELTERHWKDPEKELPATLAAMAETGLAVACCNTGLDLVTRGVEAKAERERELHALFEKLVKIKCPVVMLGSPTNDLSPAEWRREFGIGLGEAVPVAAQYGITVTFENRGGGAGANVGSSDHCKDILAHGGDGVRLTFDVANFGYMSLDHNDAFDALVDHIVHVHLKDIVAKGESFAMVPLGEGIVDNTYVMQELAKRGYEGNLSIECGGLGSDLEDARKSAEWAKRVLA